jgi:membrane-associated phospholipid phosphatase
MEDKAFKLEKNFLIKLISVISYFIIVIGTENIYKNSLFKTSQEIQINLSKSFEGELLKSTLFSFNKFITSLGTMPFFIAIFFFIFLFFPLNRPYLFMSNLFHSYFWVNLLKIIYGDPRPYWTDSSIEHTCNGGFGNPSGHAFCSTSVFLTTALIITQYKYFNNRFFLKLFIYFIFISIIILIIISRLILGAHSINQLIYGTLLGFGCYYIHCHLFCLNKIRPISFFLLFKKWNLNIIFITKYFLMFTILIIIYLSTKKKYDIERKDYDPIVQDCKKSEYRLYSEDGLFNALALTSLIGMHLGLIYFTNYIYKEKNNYTNKEIDIYNWSFDHSRKITLIYKIILLIIGALPLLLYFWIPSDTNIIVIFIFKVSIPFFTATFLIFGPCARVFLENRWARASIYIYLQNKEKSVNIREFDNILVNTIIVNK